MSQLLVSLGDCLSFAMEKWMAFLPSNIFGFLSGAKTPTTQPV